jgi:hypothetical protein
MREGGDQWGWRGEREGSREGGEERGNTEGAAATQT